jgi:hypothetical protein
MSSQRTTKRYYHRLGAWYVVATLPVPNEDFGGQSQPFRMRFPVNPGEALFKGVSTGFWLRIVEKCFPGIRRETHSERLALPSKIFVWGSINAARCDVLGFLGWYALL